MIRVVSGALLVMGMLAGSASAECAWVLWEQEQVEMTAAPMSAFDTKDACEYEMSRLLDGAKKVKGTTVLHQTVIVTLKRKDGSASTTATRYVCFPDTVDPRGPTGK